MTDEPTLRECARDFRKLAAEKGADALYAGRQDLAADVEHSIELLVAALSESSVPPDLRADPSVPLELIYYRATRAAHAVRHLKRAVRWIVDGGPPDRRARERLHKKFRRPAVLAAVAADLVDAAASDQAAAETFLDQLRKELRKKLRKKGQRVGDMHMLDDLANASADLCDTLALRAYRARRSRQPAELKELRRTKKPQPDQPPWNPRAYPQKVTTALKKSRRALLAEFREEHGDMKMEGLAAHTGLSVSAIYGAVHEKKKKCSRPKRNRFIKALGISVEKWYGR